MIIAFPSHCWEFIANQDIPKGKQMRPSEAIGFPLVVTAPIDIHAEDSIIIDVRSGRMEIIQRNGISIFRDAWKN